ncbi:MAG: DUF2723 domain-containing protein [Schleiferiaceae bacterium]|nr:DUF2723 domain-containing protein [Schleiferiaceae bacterium]
MVSNYTKINNLFGWIVFAIASFVYLATIEPTTSFWDCGEYIATSVKLQVGHPPGAPLFQLLGNFFGNLAFGDVTEQAKWVNIMSALCSAFTILFLFWNITYFGKRLAEIKNTLTENSVIAIIASGIVGALAYTFSDTFWFSAVEGEVYAMSSFFTALAFWMITRWEREADKPSANRWLVLIAYIVGLSIGVHILVFLAIPAICMVYYFKKFENPTTRGFITANIVSVGILGIVFAAIIPFTLNMFGKLEIFFVNVLRMPFNSGTIFTVILIAVGSGLGLYFTKKFSKPYYHQAVLSLLFIIIGYSTFVMLAIRSNANTPIDENNPEDALSLLAYYKREQYGDWPLLYGQYFNAELDKKTPFKDNTPIYERDEEQRKYVVSYDRKGTVRNFAPEDKGFFPRMYSDDPNHIKNYVEIAGIKNQNKRPTFGQNLKYFFKYQMNHMYWRYFMWNFVGRQNDDQGRFEITKGNWLSGIPFIDAARLGPQKNLPHYMERNKGRNHYYFFPLLLGIAGLLYQFKRQGQDAWVVFLFFFFTGIAIVLYTNHKPFEPRERDYAFAGSFYVFAIWIGLGVYALYDWLKLQQKKAATIGVGLACLVLVPGIMAKENWDDHDRSNRYVARDVAKAYLDSCAPNAILFTNGDNDTFPLWYVQEIEGYRTDVRVVNLSLLNTDWYIDQMKRKAYDGEPVPFTIEREQYKFGNRDVIYYRDNNVKGRWMLDDFMSWIKSDAPNTRFKAFTGAEIQFYPQKKVRIPINKEQVLANNAVSLQDTNRILPFIDWNLESNILSKRDIMVIDLINNNDWSRPIYFAITVGNDSKSYFWLDDYFQLEGLAYRFVPIKNESSGGGSFSMGRVNSDIMYDNFMNKFEFGNMHLPEVYLDETSRRPALNLRSIAGRLAKQLAREGEKEKAIAVADRAMEMMPETVFDFNYFVLDLFEAYYLAGAQEKARENLYLFAERLEGELDYYDQFKGNKRKQVASDIGMNLQLYNIILSMFNQYDETAKGNKLEGTDLYKRYIKYSSIIP